MKFQPKRTRREFLRLISKEEAGVIADAGGVVGVWTHLADNPLEYARRPGWTTQR